ncbi:hypothetical protein KIN20_031998 [Parelaphostrongylus tenuis]|uniref:Uncharacterized protein n=1 Tax=Parelaphostrongylus tenuis TaxID=148309 RepID=A0AAD5R7X1_PARTN|nr:hypothetical protein KIN20_031998 [Parelaphostrongylus tenuis]
MVNINYTDMKYENPPNVAGVDAGDRHTLSTEEFDEVPMIPEKNPSMSIKDIILATHGLYNDSQ